jgi:site-specific DNA recombinase
VHLWRSFPNSDFAVKAIASYLNERGFTRRGRRFSTGGIHDLLTSTTDYGRHFFNRRDSRNGGPRPPSQWVVFETPPLVTETPFNAVRPLLQSRDPKRTPQRVVNGPTFLAGIARCGYCGAALIQNTGEGRSIPLLLLPEAQGRSDVVPGPALAAGEAR